MSATDKYRAGDNHFKIDVSTPKDRHPTRLKNPSQNIIVKFKHGVVSTGGNIKLRNQKGKILETLNFDSEAVTGGIYSSDTYLFDYPYNNIAISNHDIFPYLAHDAGEEYDPNNQSHEKWTEYLRKPRKWKTSINGSFYTLLENRGWNSDIDYSYHFTIPEYNSNAEVDKSGIVDFTLSPFKGTKKLVINPRKNLKEGKLYTLDFSDSGLITASGDKETPVHRDQCFFVDKKAKKRKQLSCNIYQEARRDDNIFSEIRDGTYAAAHPLSGGYLDSEFTGKISARTNRKKDKIINYASFNIQYLMDRGTRFESEANFSESSTTTLFGEAVKKDKFSYEYYSHDGRAAIALLTIEEDYLKRFKSLKKFTGHFDVDRYNGLLEIYDKHEYAGGRNLMFTVNFYDKL